MLENDLNQRPRVHPAISLILIVIMAGLGFIVGSLLGFYIYLPFYGGTELELMGDLSDLENHPELKLPLYGMQAAATIVGLIVAPFLFLRFRQKSLAIFFQEHKWETIPVLVTVFVVIIFMGVNSVFIDWNANVEFPSFLKGFEDWARERELDAERQTKALTQFTSITELLLALLVIAVLPAIGEEIVFRGLIQNELYRGTKNIHVSIWIAAILFSAIHFQFFGFVPRVLLGALFGYLYYWSGNLTLAILAHFVNNGVSVIAIYLYQQGKFEYDVESPEAAPVTVVIFSAVVTGGLLYYFYKYFEQRKPSIDPL